MNGFSPTSKKLGASSIQMPGKTSSMNNVQCQVLAMLREGVMSTPELAREVGIGQPKDMRRRYLRLLLDMRFVEYTIPDKPNSRLRKYRLTEKGRAWVMASPP